MEAFNNFPLSCSFCQVKFIDKNNIHCCFCGKESYCSKQCHIQHWNKSHWNECTQVVRTIQKNGNSNVEISYSQKEELEVNPTEIIEPITGKNITFSKNYLNLLMETRNRLKNLSSFLKK